MSDLVLSSCYRRVRSMTTDGTSNAYLATQENLERAVVVKEVEDLSGTFPHLSTGTVLTEVQAQICKAARLWHPNIVPVLQAEVAQTPPRVVSEYAEGKSLRQELQGGQPLAPERAIHVFLQLLHGLWYAHQQGVFHRGLKPENVIIDDAGNARITDFAIAFLHTQAARPPLHIDTGSIAYSAPEALGKPDVVNARIDLFAVGIMLYEMLAGRIPGRRSRPPSSLSSAVPAGIDGIFDRLTLDDPERRYPSAEEVLEDCQAAGVKSTLTQGTRACFFLAPDPGAAGEQEEAASA